MPKKPRGKGGKKGDEDFDDEKDLSSKMKTLMDDDGEEGSKATKKKSKGKGKKGTAAEPGEKKISKKMQALMDEMNDDDDEEEEEEEEEQLPILATAAKCER